jgi:peptidoglycan L-alanyl-D-glutamate endopeptidase CwlK
MAGFVLSKRSRARLWGVHPDLVRVVERAIEISETDFMVVEGRRTLEQQRKNVLSGASKTMKSRHLTGHAVDLAPMLDLDNDGDLDVSWLQAHFGPIAKAMKQAARELGVAIEWGFDLWGWDGPHFQLPRAVYP